MVSHLYRWACWLFIFVSFALLFIDKVNGMECYVCTAQEGNVEKCTSTVRTCLADEDTCQTEVRWGSTPYWSQTAEKQYYVTKRCATKEGCEKTRKSFMPYCHHIWYEDWKCAECCQGDRCNYYAIMGAQNVQISTILLLVTSTISLLFIINNGFGFVKT